MMDQSRHTAAVPAQCTIFSIPKPFAGRAHIAQQNAIRSWQRLSPYVQVVLLGSDRQTADMADRLEVEYLDGIRTNEFGTPLVSSAFSLIAASATTPVFAYCNCDLILFDDFVEAVARLVEQEDLGRFLAIGRRTNLKLDRLVDFNRHDEVSDLRRLALLQGQRDSVVCKDYFVFPGNLFGQIPDFAVGRGNWDNWMVFQAKRRGVPVVSLTDCVLAIHQQHDYAHVGGQWQGYVNGMEARRNQELAGGRHLISGSTSDLRLSAKGLKSGRVGFLYGEFWLDFPNFARLLAKMVRSRNSGILI